LMLLLKLSCLKNFCLRLYGCELFNLNHKAKLRKFEDYGSLACAMPGCRLWFTVIKLQLQYPIVRYDVYLHISVHQNVSVVSHLLSSMSLIMVFFMVI